LQGLSLNILPKYEARGRIFNGITAIQSGTFFKMSAEFWINLQMTKEQRMVEQTLSCGFVG
jgi:hypothetical protein